MAILIKDMKMPSSCSDPNHGCDLSWCGVLCKVHNLDDISSYDEERAPFCPLIDIGEFVGQVSIVDKINDNGKVEVVKTIFVKEIPKFYEVEE